LRLALALVLLCFPLVQTAAAETLAIQGGLIHGTIEPSGVQSFKGIPFAAPPTGALRWRQPAPVVAWTGVRDAGQFGHACMQAPDRPGSFFEREASTTRDVSEDCLTLNVWTPPHLAGAHLPLLVWFYGGAWVAGASSKPLYDGSALARLGMVVVTPNYRVGVFGFLAHPALSAESASRSSGNYGLADQVAALRWVRANARAFGGDPASVTIAGQSAGGLSVDFLMSMPSAKGLFARAIVESGANVGAGPGYATLSRAETVGAAYLRNRGARTIAEMRALPAATILKSLPIDTTQMPTCPTCNLNFVPIIDSAIVPAAPSVVFAEHREAAVPFMIGATANEALPLYPHDVPPASYAAWATALWGDQTKLLMHFYMYDTPQTARRAMVQGASDNSLAGARYEASQHAATGLPTFLYRFQHAPPGRESEIYGAFHGAELAYVFGTFDAVKRPWTADDHVISQTFMSYWLNFVRNGDPNGGTLPHWDAYDAAGDSMMSLDTVSKSIPVPFPARSTLIEQRLTRVTADQESEERHSDRLR